MARAFLKPALLDEPTRAAGRAPLMATRWVANLHWVERILVLVGGTVVEEGNFTQFLAREGGVFASLYREAGARA
ncbi:MAG: hypothetical protein AB1816_17280 [Bacillota bacterium]